MQIIEQEKKLLLRIIKGVTMGRIMKQTKDGNWVELDAIPFYYPLWIRIIPIKPLRKMLKTWYWNYF